MKIEPRIGQTRADQGAVTKSARAAARRAPAASKTPTRHQNGTGR